MNPETLRALSKSDTRLAKLIAHVGPCTLVPEPRRSPFESLVRAIAHQQLTGRVAEVILGRFLLLFPKRHGRFPTPDQILALSEEQLRSVGFSRAKAVAILDVAEKTVAGVVPAKQHIGGLEDELIVERLIQVRGVGRWTAEMLLIFQLGRPDIMPLDDFGVRKGFGLLYRDGEFPTKAELREHSERWRPYRTTAAWYLWRAVECWPPGKKGK